MIRFLSPLVCFLALAFAGSASAQSLGTFRWQLQPYGSVLNLTVTQQGSIYVLNGVEEQCGGNLSLPVYGVAVPQLSGQVFLGLTSINENGRGLHTRALINLTNFNGSWSDNAGNSSQAFVFNPGTTCPGGPRTGPIAPDVDPDSLAALQAELEVLRARLDAVASRKQ